MSQESRRLEHRNLHNRMLVKTWTKWFHVVSGKGDLTGKIATFKIPQKDLPQIFSKYKLHILKTGLREESIAIYAVTQLQFFSTCFEGVTLWLSNLCFCGQKWRGNIYFVKIVWMDLNLNLKRAVTLAFDRADRTTERGIFKNWIFQVLRDFLHESILPVKAY